MFAQVTACYLAAPCRYLSNCWRVISKAPAWAFIHSPPSINNWYLALKLSKILLKSSKGQWVKIIIVVIFIRFCFLFGEDILIQKHYAEGTQNVNWNCACVKLNHRVDAAWCAKDNGTRIKTFYSNHMLVSPACDDKLSYLYILTI